MQAINFNIDDRKPLYSGFEADLYLYGDKLIKIFSYPMTEGKKEKIEFLGSLDEDILKPREIVLVRGNEVGYSMDYKENFHTINPRELSKEEKLRYIHMLKEKMDILHRHGIIHGDIKPSNIIVNGGDMYLCDLDNAKIGERNIEVLNSITYKYVKSVGTIDKHLDYYMYNLLVLRTLLGYGNITEEDLKYLRDYYYKRWEFGNDFKQIVHAMINPNEETRKSIKPLIR